MSSETKLPAHRSSRANDALNNIVGVIWGDGGDRATLEAHVAARGLTGAFRLPGWTDDAVSCHRLLDVSR